MTKQYRNGGNVLTIHANTERNYITVRYDRKKKAYRIMFGNRNGKEILACKRYFEWQSEAFLEARVIAFRKKIDYVLS